MKSFSALKKAFLMVSVSCCSAVAMANGYGYTCEKPDGTEVYFSNIKGSSVDFYLEGEFKDYPEDGVSMSFSLDPSTYTTSGEFVGKGVVESFAPGVTDSGIQFFYKGQSLRCSDTHEDPLMADMDELAYVAMVEMYDDVKDLELVMGPSGNQQGIGVTIGQSIKSVSDIKAEDVQCIRNHREGKAISTYICLHPTSNGNGVILFKIMFRYKWDTSSNKWVPSLEGWDGDGGSPIYIPNAELQKLLAQ